MTIRYFFSILSVIAFISCCHIFLPMKGMAQSIILHAVQVIVPLIAAKMLWGKRPTLSNVFLAGALFLLALTDLNYFVMMYALKMNPKYAFIDYITTIPYHVAYVLAGLGVILKFKDKKALFQDPKLWGLFFTGILFSIPFVILPLFKKFDGSPDSIRFLFISLSALLASTFLMQTSLYAFISSRNISQALFNVGLFSFAITDWAIQIETINRSQAVLSFNAFLWTMSGVIVSLPAILDGKSLGNFELFSAKSLITTMRFRLVLALAVPLLFLGFTLNSSWYGVVTISFGMIFGCITITFAVQYLYDSVLQISEVLKKSSSELKGEELDDLLKTTPLEMREALFDVMYDRIKQDRKETEGQIEMARKIRLMTAQVAHDIRSPLAMLEYALGEKQTEMVASAMKSIRQVAEDLLASEKKFAPGNDDCQEIFLIPFLKGVVDERNYLLGDQGKTVTFLSTDEEHFHTVVKAHQGQLKRVLTNLLNNALEAVDEKGEVKVGLSFESGQIHVLIKDNGPGFSASMLQNPITRGISHKDGGNGLGLSHAFETMRSWNGSVEIGNHEQGALILLRLPIIERPEILVKELKVHPAKKILVLDDDRWFIEELRLLFAAVGVEIEAFQKVGDFIERAKKISSADLSQTIFLVDHDLNDGGITGIEVIAQLNIRANAILISSVATNPEIMKEAGPLGMRVYPKGLLKHFPVRLVRASEQGRLIVLDDEKLVRRIWKDEALQRDIDCYTFPDIKSLEEKISSFSKEDFFLLDHHLEKGQRGDVIMKRLLSQGFTNVFAMSGADRDVFSHVQGLRDVLSKNPSVFFETYYRG